MAFPNIEKIKAEYTDKYVVVDESRPELARFKDVVGLVRTVNMSGRALVEFNEYHLNIGWYDIDLDFLKVVDKPEPKVEEKKPAAKKAAPAKPEAEKEAAPAKPKMSAADILAAARSGDSGAKAEAPPAPAKAEPDPPAAAAAPSKPAGKMSVSDMLAAARSSDAATQAEPAPAADPEPEPEPAAEEPVAEETTPVEEPAAEAPAAEEDGKVDRSSMSVDDMLAYCRDKDAE